MRFASIAAVFSIFSLATALTVEEPGMAVVRRNVLLERQAVTNGACCTAGVSKKQDACTVNGAQGKCVPANTANCNAALTCIANNQLACQNNVLENGKPLCRLAA